MSKTIQRRANGSGSIVYREGSDTPYNARVKVGKTISSSGREQIKYKSIGKFKNRFEAEYALQQYKENPYDFINGDIKTFSELYEAWSKEYFEKITWSAIRTIESVYRYCSMLY